MERLISLVPYTGHEAGGDSFVDRLNCRYTVFLLSGFALMVTTTHYAREPINCWCPSHFEDSHVDFTNAVCWTTDTYYLDYAEEHIPKEGDPRAMIGYYQWVPLILSFQAILFYLPRPIWMILSKKSGVSVTTITDAAVEFQHKSDPQVRQRIMSYMSNHMGRYLLELMANHAMSSHCKRFWWRIYGKYLVITYLIMKVLYLVNVIGQLFLLDRFLGLDYHWYGIDVMDRLAKGKNWRTSDRFPRVTLCDLKIRVLGNMHRYTVQCSLPMNLLNEIIFIFVWFWLAFVCLATVMSFIKWAYITIYVPEQIKYVHSRLVAMSKFNNKESEIRKYEVWDFVRKFLRRDGCLLIRLVSQNASDTIAADLICALWAYYQSHKNSITSLFHTGELAANHRESNPFFLEQAQQQLLMMNNGMVKCHSLDEISHEMETLVDRSSPLPATAPPANSDNLLNVPQAEETLPKPKATSTPTTFSTMFYPQGPQPGGTSSTNEGTKHEKSLRKIKRERSSHKKK